MLHRELAAVAAVDVHDRYVPPRAGFEEDHRDGEVFLFEPAQVPADFLGRPDDAVHLARKKTVDYRLDIVVFGLMKEAEVEGISGFVRALLDADQGPARAVIVDAAGDDADGVASALGQAAGDHVRTVPHFFDGVLNALTGVREDPGEIVNNSRDRLGGYPGGFGYMLDRHSVGRPDPHAFSLRQNPKSCPKYPCYR